MPRNARRSECSTPTSVPASEAGPGTDVFGFSEDRQPTLFAWSLSARLKRARRRRAGTLRPKRRSLHPHHGTSVAAPAAAATTAPGSNAGYFLDPIQALIEANSEVLAALPDDAALLGECAVWNAEVVHHLRQPDPDIPSVLVVLDTLARRELERYEHLTGRAIPEAQRCNRAAEALALRTAA
jgi:hypothetical protein